MDAPCVVVLRGPSGAGKSTTTASTAVACLRACGVAKVALVEEDAIRHIMLGVAADRATFSGLVRDTALAAHAAGFTVVMDGVFCVEKDAVPAAAAAADATGADVLSQVPARVCVTETVESFQAIAAATVPAGPHPHRTPADTTGAILRPANHRLRFFFWRAEQQLTVRRHATRTKRADFGAAEMLSWWDRASPIDHPDEAVVTADDGFVDTVLRVCAAAVPERYAAADATGGAAFRAALRAEAEARWAAAQRAWPRE